MVANTNTFVDMLEEAVEEISDWGVKYVEEILDVLSPDGRAFGMEKLSEEDQLKLYAQELEGNEQAWADWINTRVEKIQELLAKSGLDENAILSVHPYDIVQRAAIVYSDKMRRRLKAEQDQQALKDEGRQFRTLPPEEELSAGSDQG